MLHDSTFLWDSDKKYSKLTDEVHGDLLDQRSVAGLTVRQALVDRPVVLPRHLPHSQHGHRGLEAARQAEDTEGGVEGEALPGPGQYRQRVT